MPRKKKCKKPRLGDIARFQGDDPGFIFYRDKESYRYFAIRHENYEPSWWGMEDYNLTNYHRSERLRGL